MVINNKFELEQFVYLKTDPEQTERLVTGIIVEPFGGLLYRLSFNTECFDHHECEISANPDIIKKTS